MELATLGSNLGSTSPNLFKILKALWASVSAFEKWVYWSWLLLRFLWKRSEGRLVNCLAPCPEQPTAQSMGTIMKGAPVFSLWVEIQCGDHLGWQKDHQLPGSGRSRWHWVDVPFLAQWFEHPTSIHEDVGWIPGLAHGLRIQHCHEPWYRLQTPLGSGIAVSCGVGHRRSWDLMLLCCGSNWTPSLDYICYGCSPKKQKKKKEYIIYI